MLFLKKEDKCACGLGSCRFWQFPVKTAINLRTPQNAVIFWHVTTSTPICLLGVHKESFTFTFTEKLQGSQWKLCCIDLSFRS